MPTMEELMAGKGATAPAPVAAATPAKKTAPAIPPLPKVPEANAAAARATEGGHMRTIREEVIHKSGAVQMAGKYPANMDDMPTIDQINGVA